MYIFIHESLFSSLKAQKTSLSFPPCFLFFCSRYDILPGGPPPCLHKYPEWFLSHAYWHCVKDIPVSSHVSHWRKEGYCEMFKAIYCNFSWFFNNHQYFIRNSA